MPVVDPTQCVAKIACATMCAHLHLLAHSLARVRTHTDTGADSTSRRACAHLHARTCARASPWFSRWPHPDRAAIRCGRLRRARARGWAL